MDRSGFLTKCCENHGVTLDKAEAVASGIEEFESAKSGGKMKAEAIDWVKWITLLKLILSTLTV